jgi:hypothetical protein
MYKEPVVPGDNTGHFKMMLFGHNADCTVYDKHIRTDVVNMEYQLMRLIYNIGEIAFGAVTKTPSDPTVKINFSVSDSAYVKTDEYGHYFSQMKRLNDYVDHIEAILEMDYTSNDNTVQVHIDTVILALVWDFQAFVAQKISSIPFSVEGVAFLRHYLLKGISDISSTAFTTMQLKGLFEYIVLDTSPHVDEYAVYKRCPWLTQQISAQFPDGPVINFFDKENVTQSCNITSFYNYVLQSSTLNSIKKQTQRYIIDRVSATPNSTLLTNLKPCIDMIAYPAFGPEIKPQLRGEFGKFGLDTVVIDGMPDTVISVSQLCEGGILINGRMRNQSYSLLIAMTSDGLVTRNTWMSGNFSSIRSKSISTKYLTSQTVILLESNYSRQRLQLLHESDKND